MLRLSVVIRDIRPYDKLPEIYQGRQHKSSSFAGDEFVELVEFVGFLGLVGLVEFFECAG